jgi:glycosyltransferase involved in cell wall biosynthesis
MASRLPVIATDVGGNAETVVQGETGLLAPGGDAQAIASCLVRLLGDRDMRRRMGEAGHQRVKLKFLQSDMHRRYIEIYERLARGQPPR